MTKMQISCSWHAIYIFTHGYFKFACCVHLGTNEYLQLPAAVMRCFALSLSFYSVILLSTLRSIFFSNFTIWNIDLKSYFIKFFKNL